MEPVPVATAVHEKKPDGQRHSGLLASSRDSSPRGLFSSSSKNNSSKNSPRSLSSSRNNSPRGSPGRSPGRRGSLSRGSSKTENPERTPSPENSVNDSPRFLKSVFAKFSPIVRRKKRTESFVDNIMHSTLDDFELVKELAAGFIGKVFLCRHRTTSEYFAIKAMNKDRIIQQKQLERVFNEKKIHMLLSDRRCYQVCRAYKTFQNEDTVFLLLEYQPADLFSLLNQMKRHVMPEKDALFMTAALILSLEAQHENGVIWRDVKPQNVLIDDLGYPICTDYGFGKILSLKGADLPGLPPQTVSFVGTPAYMSPELLQRKYYDEAVDNWALGILLYECLLGDVPFDDVGGNYDKLLRNIAKGLAFPPDFPPLCRDFVERLLDPNPESRLGSQGVQEIKAHPWLKPVDWNAIKEKTVPSPLLHWVPKKSAVPDTRNYSIYELYEKTESRAAAQVSPRVREKMFEGY